MKLLFLSILICCATGLNAQVNNSKKRIDPSVFNKWGFVSDAAITNDGNYAAYCSQYGEGGDKTLVIKSTYSNWSKEFGPGIVRYEFRDDSKTVLIQYKKSVRLIALGTGHILKTYNAKSFYRFSRNAEEWILMLSLRNSLTLINSKTRKESVFENVTSYIQDKKFRRLFLLRNSQDLSWINLSTTEEVIIGKYPGISNIRLNDDGKKISFMMNEAIWFCNVDKEKPYLIIDNNSAGIGPNFSIQGIRQFNYNGSGLFVFLTEKNISSQIDSSQSKVRIWNFHDSRLITDHSGRSPDATCLALLDLKCKSALRIQGRNEESYILNSRCNDFVVNENSSGTFYEKHWNPLSQTRYFVYDCRNKKRTNIQFHPAMISPDGKFLIGLDSLMVDVVSFNVDNNNQQDITKPLKRIMDQTGVVLEDRKAWQIAGWVDKHNILLYDENDIWEIDLTGKSTPVCLTAELGKEKNLKFTFLNEPSNKIYSREELKLFRVFNNVDKSSGYYYQLSLNSPKDPIKLYMTDAFCGYILKAKNKNVWVLSKQRVDSSPNYYVTMNLKAFKPLSEMYPEMAYNWPIAQLVNFTTKNGRKSQAIVYKPSNYDSGKKYPVIINYYEKFSNELHHYIHPEAPYDNLNIPWLVSEGYIVCRPDIIYQPMGSLESALNSVEGIAKYLAKLPYVDSTNIGLDGHSWGAYETNYIVSHSNYFKAAISSSGYANLISAVNSITLKGYNYFDMSTFSRHERIGKTMWERPDIYIKYSPILDVNKISTPLLLMANERDGIVNVEQGVQFFYALRRLGKPSWLLQYPNEGHSLLNEENRIDWGLKMLGFFDHYLKGKPMPSWMNNAN